MIFVAVGTQKFPLNRLLQQLDECVQSGKLTEPIFAQIGSSDYIPKHYDYQRFLDKEEYEQKISECDVLITHSGVGTIIAGLKRKIPTIVFPRLAKYAEHVDDHQLEIAQAFAQTNYVLMCAEDDDIAELVHKAKTHEFSAYRSQKQAALTAIAEYLQTL